MFKNYNILVLIAALLVCPSFVFAGPGAFVFQGQIIRPDTTPLEDNPVNFTLQLLSETNGCLLYEETFSVDMTGSNGVFNLSLGQGTNTGNGALGSVEAAVDNSLGNLTGLTCDSGTTYNPTSGDSRRLRLTFDDGGGPITVAQDHIIESVPYAMYASTLEGLRANQFIQENTATANLSQGSLESVFDGAVNQTELMALINGTSTQYGDISGVNAGTGLTGGGASGTVTLNVDAGTGANQMVQLDGSGRLPAVDGSQLTNLPAGAGDIEGVTAGSGLSGGGTTGTVTLSVNTGTTDGTIPLIGLGDVLPVSIVPNLNASILTSGTINNARLNIGTGANQIVTLDVLSRLPAVDGSQLTNLPGAAGDIESVTAGTGLTGGGASGAVTLNVDAGTGANQIVQLDGSSRLPAVDGSQLTNLPVGAGDIESVTAGTGLTGGGASGDVTLNVNTGTTNGSIPLIGAGDVLATSIIPNLPASQITSGTINNARLDLGTGANQIVQLDVLSRLPAVDGSQLTNLPVGAGDIESVTAGIGLTGGGTSGAVTLNVDAGTGANQIVQLDGSGRLPAVDGSQLTNLPAGSSGDIEGVNAGTGLTGGGATGTVTLNVDAGTGANQIVQLDGSSRLPAVDGSQLTNLPVGAGDIESVTAGTGLTGGGASGDVTLNVNTGTTNGTIPLIGAGDVLATSIIPNLPASQITSGTINNARLDLGTGANQIVQLDGSSRLPAVDGSQLTNLPGGAGDIESVTAGTGLTGGGASGAVTLNVDAGTGANQIVQLDGSSRLPAVDGSQLTNLPGGAGDIESVTAGTGLTGGGASGDVTLNVNTGTTNGTIPLIGAGDVLATSIIPNLPASQITSGTIDNARLNIGTDVSDLVVNSAIPSCLSTEKIQRSPGPVITYSCVSDETGGDFMSDGSVAMTGNIELGSNWLSGDGGNEGIRVLANGSVGVNNTNPQGVFEIGTNSPTSSSFRFYSSSDQSSMRFTANGWANFIQSGVDYSNGSQKGIVFSSINATSRWMHIQASTGNVGIYRLNPQAKLDVDGDIRATEICDETGANCKDISTGWGSGGDIESVTAGTGLTGGGLSGAVTLNVDAGTGANQILQLDGSSRLPAVDGSQLTNLPVGAGDIESVTAGTGLTGGGASGDVTLNVNTGTTNGTIPLIGAGDVLATSIIPNLPASILTSGTINNARLDLGTGANQIVQLDASSRLPAVDGSLLTNLPGGAGDIESVTAGTGLTGGGASGDVTLNVNTGTTNGTIPLVGAGDVLATSIIPNLPASQITSGTINNARLNIGTDVSDLVLNSAIPSCLSTEKIQRSPGPVITYSCVADNTGGAGDFLADGSVAMTGNLRLNGNYLSNDGDSEGVFVDADGDVGIGNASPNSRLDVSGTIRANELCDETGANCKDVSTGWAPSPGGNNGTIQYNNAGTLAGIDNVYRLGTAGLAGIKIEETSTQNPVLRFRGYSLFPPFTNVDIEKAGTGLRVRSGTVDGSGASLSSAEVFSADASGFGIGDFSPEAHLEVSANGTTGGNILLLSSDDANDGDIMVVTESGRVGIGAPLPNSELDVSGTIRANEICDETGANCRDISAGWGAGGDITGVIAGSGLTGGGLSGDVTLNVDTGVANGDIPIVGAGDVLATSIIPNLPATIITSGTINNSRLDLGTGANQIVQLDVSSRLPAVDGSQLTNLPVGAGDIESVTAGTGLTGGGASGDVTLNVNTGTTNGTIPLIGAGDVLATSVIPNLPASILTSGTINNARLDLGTGANQIVQLDGSSRLPAVDGSQLTNLPSVISDEIADADGNTRIQVEETPDEDIIRFDIANEESAILYRHDTLNRATSLRIISSAVSYDSKVQFWDNSSHLGNIGFDGVLDTVDMNALGSELTFSIDNDEQARIDSSGFLGLGTPSPDTPLDIRANENAMITLDRTAQANIDDIAHMGVRFINATSNDYFYIGQGSAFNTTDQQFVLQFDTGNVGIGTLDPQSRLDVNGTVRAPEICDETGANCKDISTGWGAGGDITGVTAGTGLTGGGLSGDVTLNVDTGTTNGTIPLIGAGDVLATSIIPNLPASQITSGTINNARLDLGTGANQIVQLDGSSRLPAVDGSQLTNLPGAAGDIESVTAGTGLTGGGASGDVTLNVNTGTTDGTIPLIGAGDVLATSIIPNLPASQITSGTINNARLNIGTDASDLVINSAIPSCLSSQKIQRSPGPVITYSCVADNTGAGGDFMADGSVPMTGELELLSEASALTPDLTFDGDTNTGFYRPAADTLGFVTNSTERVRINSSGNIAVGLSSGLPNPEARIHINGPVVPFGEPIDQLSELSLILFSGDNAGAYRMNRTVGFSVNSSNSGSGPSEYNMGIHTTNEVRFYDTAAATPFVVMSSTNERVGIGRVDPQSKLDVNGTIRANEICDETGANCQDISVGWSEGDITGVTAGTGLTGGGLSGDVTLNVDTGTTNGTIPLIGAGDVLATSIIPNLPASQITSGTIDNARLDLGTGANQIVQLDGSSRLPAVDGSQLTNLPGAAGDIESVTAGTGLTGGGASGDVTLNVNTGTTNGTIPVVGAGDVLATSIIPNLPASQITSGTLSNARLNIGTDASDLVVNSSIPSCAANQKIQRSAGPVITYSCVADIGGAGDFMADGSVPMTGNLRLNDNWLSNDGGNEGVLVSDTGQVSIGRASTNGAALLYANGQIRSEVWNASGTPAILLNLENEAPAATGGGTQIMFEAANTLAGSIGTIWENASTDDSAMVFSTRTVGPQLREVARFSSAGHLGIGTNDPERPLTVTTTNSTAGGEGFAAEFSYNQAVNSTSVKHVLGVSANGYSSGFSSGSIGIISSVANANGTLGGGAEFVGIAYPNSGTIMMRKSFEVLDAIGAGSIDQQRGLSIEELNKGGVSNHAIYTEGSTPSYFGGNIGIGPSRTDPSAALDVNGAVRTLASIEVAAAEVSSTANYTIPDTSRNIRRIELTANTTITLPGLGAIGTDDTYTLTIKFKQDATGGRTVSWNDGGNTIKWDGGSAPGVASGADEESIIQFTVIGGENTWYGSLVWSE